MDVYNHIRKTGKQIPILFASGNMEFIEAIEVLKQNDPFLAHVSKPCLNFDYIDRINRMLAPIK